jgi:hypothetical protein
MNLLFAFVQLASSELVFSRLNRTLARLGFPLFNSVEDREQVPIQKSFKDDF